MSDSLLDVKEKPSVSAVVTLNLCRETVSYLILRVRTIYCISY